MHLTIGIALLCATLVHSRTTVSVVEIGKGGTVHSTNAADEQTFVAAVKSFWAKLHGHDETWEASPSSAQHQSGGMNLVPDLFRRADSGLVLGLSSKDPISTEHMPFLTNLITEKSVGRTAMTLDGSVGDQLYGADAYDISIHSVEPVSNALNSVALRLEDGNDNVLDGQIAALVQRLTQTLSDGQTIVLHFVIEEQNDTTGFAFQSSNRRLAEDGESQRDRDAKNQQKYTRKAKDGTIVTIYPSMFNIQHYNVVTWASLGLLLLLFATMANMVFMPLEPDTLLFGESGKIQSASAD